MKWKKEVKFREDNYKTLNSEEKDENYEDVKVLETKWKKGIIKVIKINTKR